MEVIIIVDDFGYNAAKPTQPLASDHRGLVLAVWLQASFLPKDIDNNFIEEQSSESKLHWKSKPRRLQHTIQGLRIVVPALWVLIRSGKFAF